MALTKRPRVASRERIARSIMRSFRQKAAPMTTPWVPLEQGPRPEGGMRDGCSSAADKTPQGLYVTATMRAATGCLRADEGYIGRTSPG